MIAAYPITYVKLYGRESVMRSKDGVRALPKGLKNIDRTGGENSKGSGYPLEAKRSSTADRAASAASSATRSGSGSASAGGFR